MAEASCRPVHEPPKRYAADEDIGPELILGISARRWVTVLAVRNERSVGGSRGRADVNTLVLDYAPLSNAVRTNRDPEWQPLFTLVFWKPNPAVFGIERCSESGPEPDCRCLRGLVDLRLQSSR